MRIQDSGFRIRVGMFILLSSLILHPSSFPQEPIGPVTRVTTNELQAISNQLPAVSVVTPSVVGAQGGALYYYWVIARYGMNVVTQDQPAGNAPPSQPALIATAPTPLNGTNYVRVCWNTVPNATGYDVLRTTSSGLPNGAANIAVALNTAGNCVNDQGAPLQSYTLNTYNPAKNPLSLKWGRLDMPKITPPPQPAPVGQCRLFVNRTTNSFDAVDETGASCFPTPAPPPPGALCTDLAQSTDFYVSPTGSDTTGDGTPGNPWKTVMMAVNQIPMVVCGKYTIHLAPGTYPQTFGSLDVDGIHIDGRAFGGGGVGGFNAPAPPGGTYWPWESAWIEIVGDPFPGDPDTGGQPDDYLIDHGSFCDGDAAVSMAGANVVLRGLSIRNAGIGILAHSSKIQPAGLTFQKNCTDMDVGFQSLIWYDQNDSDIGSWCGTNFCYYNEFRLVSGSFKNWGLLLHDDVLMSDETANDIGGTTGSSLNFTCVGCAATSAGVNNLIEKNARIGLGGGFTMQNTLANGGAGSIQVSHDSILRAHFFYWDATGLVGTSGPAIDARHRSLVDIDDLRCRNGTRCVSLYPDSFLVNTGIMTNVATPYIVGATINPGPFGIFGRFNAMALGIVPVTVPFSATPVFNPSVGSQFIITLMGDVTSSSFTSGVTQDGQLAGFLICQDGGGAHTFVWPTNVKGADTIGATASTCNSQWFSYQSSTGNWYAVGAMVKNQ